MQRLVVFLISATIVPTSIWAKDDPALIPVVKMWEDLQAVTPIDLGDGVKIRLGLESNKIPRWRARSSRLPSARWRWTCSPSSSTGTLPRARGPSGAARSSRSSTATAAPAGLPSPRGQVRGRCAVRPRGQATASGFGHESDGVVATPDLTAHLELKHLTEELGKNDLLIFNQKGPDFLAADSAAVRTKPLYRIIVSGTPLRPEARRFAVQWGILAIEPERLPFSSSTASAPRPGMRSGTKCRTW